MPAKLNIITNDSLLVKLKYYLNYELSSTLLFILWYSPFTLIVVSILAIVFAPFMIYVLYKTGKKGWLIFFTIMIILPPVSFVIFAGFNFYLMVLLYVELGLFYFYCVILRFVVNDWVEENSWKAVRKEQEEGYKLEKEVFEWEMNRKSPHERS